MPGSRQGAQKWNETGTGADIDHVQLGPNRRGLLHGLDGAADHAFVVGVRLAVIVLKIGLRVELVPLIVCIAKTRLGRPVVGHDVLQGIPTLEVMTCTATTNLNNRVYPAAPCGSWTGISRGARRLGWKLANRSVIWSASTGFRK